MEDTTLNQYLAGLLISLNRANPEIPPPHISLVDEEVCRVPNTVAKRYNGKEGYFSSIV
jgi:hypothetical protein